MNSATPPAACPMHAEDPKYSENPVFRAESGESRCRIEPYFKRLHVKFVTRRINGIFHTINEFERP